MSSLAERLESLALANHVPLSVHFELTHRCNLRCFHCCTPRDDGDELSFEEVLSVLEQLAEAGCLFLTLTGGEIFLRDDLFEVLGAASRMGFALTLFTNGTLIGPEAADEIERSLPLRVDISVYGKDGRTHDQVTGVSGSFTKSLEAVRLLRERGVEVTLKSPLMKENSREYVGMVRLAQSLGVNYRLDPIVTPKHDGSREPLSHRITGEELKQALCELGLYPKLPRPVNPDGRELLCNAGVSGCSISPYGDVYPCIQLLLKLGNLRENPFQRIWEESEHLFELKDLRNCDLPTCRSCQLSSYCNRCPGLALLEDGDILGPCTASCQLAELRQSLAESWARRVSSAAINGRV